MPLRTRACLAWGSTHADTVPACPQAQQMQFQNQYASGPRMPAINGGAGGGHESNSERHSYFAGPPPHRRPSPPRDERDALSTSWGKYRKRAGVRKSRAGPMPAPNQVCVYVCARAHVRGRVSRMFFFATKAHTHAHTRTCTDSSSLRSRAPCHPTHRTYWPHSGALYVINGIYKTICVVCFE